MIIRSTQIACAVATLISLALLATPSAAAVITFDGVGVNTADPVTVDGFTFDYLNRNGWAIGIPGAGLAGDFNNGTDVILIRDTQDFTMTIRMTEDTNAPFSLQSFDAADFFTAAAGGMNIDVVGFLNGGGTVSTSISTNAGVYTNYTLPGTFTNLLSVEFQGTGSSLADGFVLDNIEVNSMSAVPEPTSFAVWGIGVVSVCVLGRRRRKAVR